MKQNLNLIKDKLKQSMPELKKDFHVENLAIFGSVAKRIEMEDSDVDILVNFSDPPGFFTFMKLEEELSDLLQRKVDLVTGNALKNTIKQDVLNHIIYV